MTPAIRTLLPPGGFHNSVGYHVAALDVGLEALRAAAISLEAGHLHEEPAPGLPSVAASIRATGEREATWIHQGVGKVPTPPPPAGRATVEQLVGWLDAVRTVTLMVLRPLPDRELERLITLPGVDGPTTLRRVLTDLAEHQAFRRGEIATGAAIRATASLSAE